MYLWLELFLISAGISARLIIPASTCGSGVNLLVVIFIWLALLVHLLDKSKSSAPTPGLPASLKALLILFGAFVIISFISAPYKFGAFQYLTAWLSDLVLFYLVYSLCVRDAKYIPVLLSVFLAIGLMVVLYGLFQHFWELRDLAVQIQQNPSLLDSIPMELRGATLARAQAGEPFATFTYQNSFGAFLALIIPLFMTLALIRQKMWWIGLVIVLVALFVLVTTGSKGAIVAMILGIGLASGIYYFLKAPSVKRGVLLFSGMIIAIVLLGFITHFRMSDSFNVRLGYWDATVKIIRDNPLSGVGLNQFSNSYLYYKSADAGEVLKAHNDYLQIASEMGILALLVFLSIWFIILKSIVRPAREANQNSAPSTPHSSTLPYILGAGFAFCLSEIFQSPLIALDIPIISTVIVFALWLGAFLLLLSFLRKQESSISLIRIGLFAGLVAFLIHCTVDFNIYVQGLSMSVWFIGAVLLSTVDSGGLLVISGIGKKVINGLVVILVIGVIGILSVLAMKFITFDPFPSLEDRNKVKEPVAFACFPPTWNPYAVEPKLTLAWWYHRYVDFSDDSIEPRCLKYISEAISLNPLAPMLYNQQGRLYLEHAEQERKAGHEKLAKIYEQRAKRAFQMVRELYPTYKDNKK